MSENNKDLEKQAEENLDSEIIESVSITEESDTVEPVVVKKGSFLSFIAFVFSIAALALSGYMYYQQNIQPQTNTDDWKDSVTKLEAKVQNQAESLASELSSFNIKQQAISTQVQSFKTEKTAVETTTEKFDDSVLKQNISQLQEQLISQQQKHEQLQEVLLKNNNQQSQALLQFKQNYKKDMGTQSITVETMDPIEKQRIINIDLIESYLFAAHKDLNVQGNVRGAEAALRNAINKLNELSDVKYSGFINELNSTATELNTSKKVDVFGLNTEVGALELSINKLSFVMSQATDENQESSWYDNLIKIKKIDDSEQQLLTQSEQAGIRHTLKLHFDLLRRALINQNQDLWVSEIDALSIIIKKYFSAESEGQLDTVLSELASLGIKNINPSFPDLAVYLQKFNVLLNNKGE